MGSLTPTIKKILSPPNQAHGPPHIPKFSARFARFSLLQKLIQKFPILSQIKDKWLYLALFNPFGPVKPCLAKFVQIVIVRGGIIIKKRENFGLFPK